MSSPCQSELSEFNRLIWGDAPPDSEVFKRWSQGFKFSPAEPSALVQNCGGPCAVLAPIQAVILRDLLCLRRQPASKFDELDGMELLISACLDLMNLIRTESTQQQFRWLYWEKQDDELSDSSQTENPISFFTNLKLVVADSVDELHGIILSLADSLQSSYGVLCFLYSALFTYGAAALREGMAEETDPLIDPVHGHASQCLINLFLTGQATPHLFDGVRTVSGISMTGIRKQPPTGYLTLFEALQYCEAGWYLKNPSNPVWILASETHFTVLASADRRLVRQQQTSQAGSATIHQAELEFNRFSSDQDAKSGFIESSQLGPLLQALNIPHTEASLTELANKLDPEELGVILRDAFLRHFFPQEMANRGIDVREFQLVHYNGLVKSDNGGQVRYDWGDALLIDPTDELIEKDPVDSNPIHRCLRTKWPTIRIKWKNGRVPSLN